VSAAVEFDAVSVVRRGRRLVDAVGFTVRPGAVHALLGHNGAGKTTLMRALAGLVPVSEGSIRTGSEPAVLFLGSRLPGDLTVAQVLDYRRRVVGASRDAADAVVRRTGIGPFLDRRAGVLSTGMAQRTAIAVALLADARTVVLDEPTNGLDPQGVDGLLRLIDALRAEGRAVVICSHDLAQLELVCDDVTCLRAGRVTADGTVREVSRDLPAPGHVLRTSDDGRAAEILGSADVACCETPRGLHVDPGETLSGVLDLLAGRVTVLEATVDRGLFGRIYAAHASAPDERRARRGRR
jgi:ABC-type multidrug transport system ATPase subunit